MKKTLVLALAAIMVLGVAGAAFADSVIYPGAPNGDVPPKQVAAGTVLISASVNPKITLTITTPNKALDGTTDAAAQTLDFQALNPGTTSSALTVGLGVTSNKAYSLTAAPTLGANWAANGLALNRTPDAAIVASNPKTAAATFTDSYTITVPASADPVAYTGSVLYTATQL